MINAIWCLSWYSQSTLPQENKCQKEEKQIEMGFIFWVNKVIVFCWTKTERAEEDKLTQVVEAKMEFKLYLSLMVSTFLLFLHKYIE